MYQFHISTKRKCASITHIRPREGDDPPHELHGDAVTDGMAGDAGEEEGGVDLGAVRRAWGGQMIILVRH